MTRKKIDKISFKIDKEDYELQTMVKRIEQMKLNKSEICKRALKFYYNTKFLQTPDPKYENILLEYERKAELEKFNESKDKMIKINQRLKELRDAK